MNEDCFVSVEPSRQADVISSPKKNNNFSPLPPRARLPEKKNFFAAGRAVLCARQQSLADECMGFTRQAPGQTENNAGLMDSLYSRAAEATPRTPQLFWARLRNADAP